jgi:hypothetical protein
MYACSDICNPCGVRQHGKGSPSMKEMLDCCHYNLLPVNFIALKSQGNEFQGSHDNGHENAVHCVILLHTC